MIKPRILSILAASALLGGVASAQTGAAITVIKIGIDGGNQNNFHYYGQNGGIAAYSFATTSCNPGTTEVIWTSSNHPVIGQNIFRLKDGRFEQLGQSWLKHGFCAINEPGCGSCQSTPCSTLGVGCADTFWATLNDGASGGPKWQVNASTGDNIPNHPTPTGPNAIRGRLQIPISEIDPNQNNNSQALYWAEAQYISNDTCDDQNGSIASATRRLNIVSTTNIDGGGATQVNQCATFAWREADPQVAIQNFATGENPGQGVFSAAYRVRDLGNEYEYQYCVYNISSDRSAYSISLPFGDAFEISDLYINTPDYHSGEPFDNASWEMTQTANETVFHSPQTHAQNPNSNALRWGTMITIQFRVNSAPTSGQAALTLFKPGPGNDETPFNVMVPGGVPDVGTAYCSGDGTGTFCPCLNFGNADRGCSNGAFFQGAGLSASGVASVSSDSVTLETDRASPNQPGLYFSGTEALNGGDGFTFGDGLRCAGTGVLRLETTTSNAQGDSTTSIGLAAQGGVSAGDTLYYQFWYRDPNGSPCGQLFNLSNGLEISWSN